MEMNTRLQVEHPITEMITGQDLVEWQLLVASGEKLPKTQEQLAISGHAIETRLYAEDAANNFMPSTGELWACEFPENDGFTRVDAGVREGDEVTAFYDPMIAKLITYGSDRESARRRHLDCLAKTKIGGITTNIPLLDRIMRSSEFTQGEVTTHFLTEHPAMLVGDGGESGKLLVLAALAAQKNFTASLEQKRAQSLDPHSPWSANDGWRVDGNTESHFDFHVGDNKQKVELSREKAVVDDQAFALSQIEFSGDKLNALLNGEAVEAFYKQVGRQIQLLSAGQYQVFSLIDPLERGSAEAASGGLSAPMPGSITSIAVHEGQSVSKGDHLLTMEAMKMEIAISAPDSGKVTSIPFSVGSQVEQGQALIVLEAEE